MNTQGLRLGDLRLNKSLSTQVIVIVVLAELLFGMVIGTTIGIYGARLATEERRMSMELVSAAVFASLMPMIADQDTMRVDAQLHSILVAAGNRDISCIRVFDSTGQVVAASEGGPDCCSDISLGGGFIGTFTKPQYVSMPVVVDDVEVGGVIMEFAPIGFARAIGSHMIAALVVIASVVLVSAPWAAWLVLGSVVHPIGRLRDGAGQLASGRRDLVLYDGRQDEIGQLAEAFDEMTRELAEKEFNLEMSFGQLEEAYNAEAMAKQRLEHWDQMKSDFVAVASHELRAPLSVIKVYAEMLEGQELGALSETSQQAVSSIVSATARLSSIVADLMDAALLERGLLPLEFDRVHIDELIVHAVEDANALAESHGVEIRLDGELREIDAWVDPLRIRQVLDNLLSNSVKYSAGSTEILVRAQFQQDFVEISIIDWGQGVPDEKAAELFSLFGRLDSGNGQNAAGLGLGLAISARVAHAHGGSLTYDANPAGKGSVFTFRLPVGHAGKIDEQADIRVTRGDDSQ